MGLVCGVGCVEGAPGSLRFWGLFFEPVSEATFFDLGAILGGFGEAKMVPKSIFGRFFGSFFSHAISASILDRFLEAPNLKNRALASTGARILQNRRFQKMIKKRSILDPFWDAKTMKIGQKLVSKNMFFFIIEFSTLFFDFGSILGGPGGPGPSKKSGKIDQDAQKMDFGACLGRVCFLRWVLGGFWEDFGRVLGRFWEDFARILGGFWKGFGRMLGG